MYMPRLSLYKPERGKDFEFLDRQINEMFTIGGTDLFVHKYTGTNDGTTIMFEDVHLGRSSESIQRNPVDNHER